MTSTELIADAINRIIAALREGEFTKDDLQFLLRFFRELIEVTERKLGD